jgi:ketosteroid isomerase-like protein
MPRTTPLPPLAAVLSFIDAINRGDLDTLAALMTDDHRLLILDEPPVVGREANTEAWHGYASAFPEYVIYPWRIAATGDRVAVLGGTTGSHLGLSDERELELSVLWVAEVTDGRLATWQIVEDTPEARERLALDAPL